MNIKTSDRTLNPTQHAKITITANATKAPVAPTPQPVSQEPITPVQANLEAPKTPAVAEDPQLSSKFAALARKEKAIRQRYQEIQQKEAEMKALNEEISKAKLYRERLKSNPLDVLNEEGITYDQLVNQAVNQPNPDMLALRNQVAALEETLKRQSEENQKSYQTQREQAVKQISMDVKEVISSNPSYEVVRDMKAEDAVTELITQTYDEEGILLTVDQAAKQVNDYLAEEALRLASIDSIKKRLTPATPPQPEASKQPDMKITPTLSNTMQATQSPKRVRTEAERKRDAILAAQGKLNR